MIPVASAPMITNAVRETRRIRVASFSLPFSAEAETILLMATGSPHVEIM